LSRVNMGIKGEIARRPGEALAGGVFGYEENEEGDVEIDPMKAFLGMAAAGFLGLNLKKQQGVSDLRSNQAKNLSSDLVEDTAVRNLPDQPKLQTGIPVEKLGQAEYPLSSQTFSVSLAKEYASVAGKSIDEAVDGLGPTEFSVEKVGKYGEFRKNFEKAWVKTVEVVQDNMIRVRNLIQDPTVKVTDDTNPYLAELLFHGRVGFRLKEAKDKFVAIDKDVVETSKKVGISGEDMTLLVNKFLHARHTPERNAKLGDGASGLTNVEADLITKSLEALPYSSEVKRIADQVQEMNNETLDLLLEAQVIDREAYDAMRDVYKNHVPLNRILKENEDVASSLTGRGFDVRGTGIKRAKGSDLQVADIMANVVVNYEQAIIRSEKNLVDLTLLQFVKDNPQVTLFEEVKPKVIGRKFDRPGKSNLNPEEEAYLSDREIPPVMEQDVSILRDKIDNTWANIYGEMDYATAGKRKDKVWLDESGNIDKITSTRSTFPNWVPEEGGLRDKALFNKVLDLHSTGKVPRANATRERALLDIMEGEMLKRLPLNLQEEVALSYLAKENETLASVYAKAQSARGQLIFEQVNDPRVLSLRKNGKPVHLLIKDDDLAVALKGVNHQHLPGLLKFIGTFTRLYSGLQTRFNPEFAFPNKIRDLQEAVVYAGSRGELGFKSGIKGALDQRSYKDIVDFMSGKDTEGAKLYRQMQEDGGTTGGMGLSTREQIELDLTEIRNINRSNPRQAAEMFITKIDQFNTIFEDSTRLSLYKQALKNGVSRKRAAMIAKEASVNFNKFGTGGPVLNALFMFANASIQGTTKMLRAMKNPKVAATVTTAVGTAVLASGEWNDRIDPDWRDKVTKWDRINSITMVLPSTDESGFDYVSIPVGWGIKPVKVSMDYLYDSMVGKGQGWQDSLNAIGAATVNAYNPLGGSDIFSSVTPTIMDIPLEVARNKAWHGGAIMPDWDKNAPDSIRYFPSLQDNSTGKIAVQLSEGLSGVGIEVSPAAIYYAYQGYVGGAGRTATDFINTIITAGTGEMPEPNDIPVWSRFVRQRDNEEIGEASQEYEMVKEVLAEQSKDRFYLKQDAENTYRQLSSMDAEEAAKVFDDLIVKDPELAKKVNEIMDEEELGLTYTQRLIKQLGVENGQRATFIANKLNSLKTQEEKAELWDEYVEKKLITNSVAEQLDILLED
jgi:DNA-directed RNA polymerase subunit F